MLNKSILCGLFLLLWQSSFGQTVEGLYLEAAQNNPSLKVAYQEYLNSLQEIERIGPIDPTLNAGYFIRPMMMADGEQRAMFSLMQMFPWFGTLNSDRAMRNSMAEVRYQAFLQMANEVLFQMRSFLIERESAQIQLKSLNEKLILLENMQELARASIESGQGELAMVIKLNQQQDQMETEQLLLQNEIEELEIKLLLMAGRSPSDRPLDLKYDLPNWQEVDFADIELNVNPQWQALVAESKVYNQQKDLARREGMPMLGAGLNYTIVSPLDGMSNMGPAKNLIQPMFAITLPIYRSKYKASQKLAEMELKRVDLEKGSLENEWRRNLASIEAEVARSLKRVDLYERQINRNVDLLSLANAGIEAGGNEAFNELLQIEMDQLNLQLQLEMEKVTLAKLRNEVMFLFAIEFNDFINETRD